MSRLYYLLTIQELESYKRVEEIKDLFFRVFDNEITVKDHIFYNRVEWDKMFIHQRVIKEINNRKDSNENIN